MIHYLIMLMTTLCQLMLQIVLQLALEPETVKIMDWFKTNCMKANPSKFQMLTVGLDTKSDFKICIDDTEINNDVCVKLLGGHIDNQLNFNKHILEICIKAGRQLIALKRLSQRLTTNSKLCIFRSFIFNHFNYCPIVWHFCIKYNTVTREKIQERGLRFVCKTIAPHMRLFFPKLAYAVWN